MFFHDMVLHNTQVPDFLNARIDSLPVKEVIKDHKWLENEFTEKVQKVKLLCAIWYDGIDFKMMLISWLHVKMMHNPCYSLLAIVDK